MAASSPSQDVQEPGYRNYLKVGLALGYMKTALESFVGNQVNSMHESLKKKMYFGTTVPYPKCERCKASDITQNKDNVWGFGDVPPCRVWCHVWFKELLKLFHEPCSNRIYWSNCDVTSWAFKPWECAKAFMPRGQDRNNTDPSKSDHQALLTLMVNCKHFHELLTPKGLKLIRKVSTVRNKTIHAPQMALTDAEMRNYTQEIITLLEDSPHLRHLSACVAAVSDIKQIRDASLLVCLDWEKALEELQGKAIGKLQKEIDSQKGQIKLGKRRCDRRQRQTDSKMRKLDKQVVAIQEKTRGPMHPTEKDVQDIQQLLIKAYESVRIISVSPVFYTAVNLKDLEDFYTDVVIEEERDDSAQRRTDKQQVDKEKVTSFKQIFDNGDKKRTILKAPAGQGKSTFCRKLVHTWCSVQKKKLNPLKHARICDKSETNGLKDEDEMLKFDVLLYICLRDISDEKRLMDVVHKQFPLHESQGLSHKSHIEELIGQADSNKVLLIMDGLDEMDNSSSFIENIMQRRLYPHLTVLATTRPWKIGQLGLSRSAHIDLLLDLQGFSYENSMLFAKRIFDKYYKDESAIAKFKCDIWGNSVIESLIKVPLLLLFIVHVWYERKSFPQSMNELYLEIVNVMVNRYLEGKERKQKSKGGQDEKKDVVLKTWTLESTAFTLTPKLRNLSLVQHFGEGFLAALCEVANQFLITDAEAASLVFEEKSLVKLLGNDELSKLQIALDMGIFSNSDSPGIFGKKICLTFLHKTIQEFLTAINICCREDSCTIFLDSLNTLDDVFENEMIIKFVAGISTSHCQKIFEKIYEVCDKDMDQWYGKYHMQLCDKDMDQKDRIHHMSSLHRLYVDTIREACEERISLKVHSLVITELLQSTLMNTSDGRTHLKCLVLFSCNLDDATLELLSKCTHLKYLKLAFCTLDDATLDLSECTSLTELSLENVTMKDKLLPSKCSLLEYLNLHACKLPSKCAHLEYMNLVSCNLDDATLELLSKCTHLKYLNLYDCKLDDATLDLSECTSLTELSLEYVTIKVKLLLTKCTQLKCLNLVHCSLKDITLDLSECTSLTKISLEKITLNGKLLPSKCTHLKCLELDNCNLKDTTLDFSECTSMTKLSLGDVTMKGKLLLSKCTHLELLDLLYCNLDDAKLDLSECTSLTKIRLENVTMKGKLLLSKCTQLKCLELYNCNLDDTKLDLSECTSLTKISLVNVTMKGELLLSKCIHLWCLDLCNFNLDDATLNLSECTSLSRLILLKVIINGKLTLELSKSICLRELYIDYMILDDTLGSSDSAHSKFGTPNVKLSDAIQEMLCSSLSQCKQLDKLTMKNVDLGDALLSLDGLDQLKELTFDNVTMGNNQKVMLCNRLSQCKQLHRLSMKNVDLGDTLLSLDGLDQLKELTLNNVTMGKDSKEMLFKSLSKSQWLETLSVKNMNLDEALLSFDGLDQLKELTHNNVTMGNNRKIMLCNRLSQCKQLHRLSMKNVDLGDALLSLDGLDQLKELTLDNVTMGTDRKLMLCNSLSQCKLDRLSMKNVDLGDALLSLDGLDQLNELTLINVTMGNNRKVMLCNSLSQCKQLHRLSMINDGLNQHKQFTLDNVTMDKESKEMLFRSLSKCLWLRILSIKNMNLDDALLSLDGFGVLHKLTLDNITIGKDSKEMLLKSLFKSHLLKTLSIRNMNLDDALLSLDGLDHVKELTHDGLDWLKNLALDNVTMGKNSKEMLFKSLYKSQWLETLSVKNMNLDDVLLSSCNFHTMNRLIDITIDNVEMGKISKVLMCNSLSQCTKLMTLSLKNLDLGDGLLSLDKMEKLCNFTVNKVIMCKNGYVMLCNSMSECTELKYLQLMKQDLGDAMPRLDNLCEVDLVNTTISLESVDYIKSSGQHLKPLHDDFSAHTGECNIEKAADSCEKCVVNSVNIDHGML